MVKEKRSLFEGAVGPQRVFENLVLIISNPQANQFAPKITVSALKVMHRMAVLDMHPDFHYSDERHNPYFGEACKYFSVYVRLIKQLAEFYQGPSYDRFLSELRNSQEQDTGMQVDCEAATKPIVTTDCKDWGSVSTLASQRFLKALLTFTHSLVGYRSRTMQTQLYPQLVEPIVQIIGVMPRDHAYTVNLDCQKNALQILKEITKSQTFDDSSQLLILIERLKREFNILKLDFEGQGDLWKASELDDNEFCILSLSKRQDFIGSCLRFLCYSIIRTDPN